jgi:hypothetical protein
MDALLGSGSAAIEVQATASPTLDGMSVSFLGVVVVQGNSSDTLASLAITADGSVQTPLAPIQGDASITLGALSIAAPRIIRMSMSLGTFSASAALAAPSAQVSRAASPSASATATSVTAQAVAAPINIEVSN